MEEVSYNQQPVESIPTLDIPRKSGMINSQRSQETINLSQQMGNISGQEMLKKLGVLMKKRIMQILNQQKLEAQNKKEKVKQNEQDEKKIQDKLEIKKKLDQISDSAVLNPPSQLYLHSSNVIQEQINKHKSRYSIPVFSSIPVIKYLNRDHSSSFIYNVGLHDQNTEEARNSYQINEDNKSFVKNQSTISASSQRIANQLHKRIIAGQALSVQRDERSSNYYQSVIDQELASETQSVNSYIVSQPPVMLEAIQYDLPEINEFSKNIIKILQNPLRSQSDCQFLMKFLLKIDFMVKLQILREREERDKHSEQSMFQKQGLKMKSRLSEADSLDTMQQMVQVMGFLQVERNQTVFDFNAQGDLFYIVIEGRISCKIPLIKHLILLSDEELAVYKLINKDDIIQIAEATSVNQQIKKQNFEQLSQHTIIPNPFDSDITTLQRDLSKFQNEQKKKLLYKIRQIQYEELMKVMKLQEEQSQINVSPQKRKTQIPAYSSRDLRIKVHNRPIEDSEIDILNSETETIALQSAIDNLLYHLNTQRNNRKYYFVSIFQETTQYGPNTSFGELALITNKRRQARLQVTNQGDAYFAILSKKDYRMAQYRVQKKLLVERVSFLRQFELFKDQSEQFLSSLTYYSIEIECSRGQVIFSEDVDMTDFIYMVKFGEFECYKKWYSDPPCRDQLHLTLQEVVQERMSLKKLIENQDLKKDSGRLMKDLKEMKLRHLMKLNKQNVGNSKGQNIKLCIHVTNDIFGFQEDFQEVKRQTTVVCLKPGSLLVAIHKKNLGQILKRNKQVVNNMISEWNEMTQQRFLTYEVNQYQKMLDEAASSFELGVQSSRQTPQITEEQEIIQFESPQKHLILRQAIKQKAESVRRATRSSLSRGELIKAQDESNKAENILINQQLYGRLDTDEVKSSMKFMSEKSQMLGQQINFILDQSVTKLSLKPALTQNHSVKWRDLKTRQNQTLNRDYFNQWVNQSEIREQVPKGDTQFPLLTMSSFDPYIDQPAHNKTINISDKKLKEANQDLIQKSQYLDRNESRDRLNKHRERMKGNDWISESMIANNEAKKFLLDTSQDRSVTERTLLNQDRITSKRMVKFSDNNSKIKLKYRRQIEKDVNLSIAFLNRRSIFDSKEESLLWDPFQSDEVQRIDSSTNSIQKTPLVQNESFPAFPKRSQMTSQNDLNQRNQIVLPKLPLDSSNNQVQEKGIQLNGSKSQLIKPHPFTSDSLNEHSSESEEQIINEKSEEMKMKVLNDYLEDPNLNIQPPQQIYSARFQTDQEVKGSQELNRKSSRKEEIFLNEKISESLQSTARDAPQQLSSSNIYSSRNKSQSQLQINQSNIPQTSGLNLKSVRRRVRVYRSKGNSYSIQDIKMKEQMNQNLIKRMNQDQPLEKNLLKLSKQFTQKRINNDNIKPVFKEHARVVSQDFFSFAKQKPLIIPINRYKLGEYSKQEKSEVKLVMRQQLFSANQEISFSDQPEVISSVKPSSEVKQTVNQSKNIPVIDKKQIIESSEVEFKDQVIIEQVDTPYQKTRSAVETGQNTIVSDQLYERNQPLQVSESQQISSSSANTKMIIHKRATIKQNKRMFGLQSKPQDIKKLQDIIEQKYQNINQNPQTNNQTSKIQSQESISQSSNSQKSFEQIHGYEVGELTNTVDMNSFTFPNLQSMMVRSNITSVPQSKKNLSKCIESSSLDWQENQIAITGQDEKSFDIPKQVISTKFVISPQKTDLFELVPISNSSQPHQSNNDPDVILREYSKNASLRPQEEIDRQKALLLEKGPTWVVDDYK